MGNNKEYILNMAKEMTREEFINETKHGKLKNDCPNDYYGLCEMNCIGEEKNCTKCWTEAVKDIKFKDDIKQKTINQKDKEYKWVFDVDEFKHKPIPINCETKEESEQLFDIFIKNGINKWTDGNNLLLNDIRWFNKSTYYIYNNLYNNGIFYVILEKCLHGYKFSEIDFSQCYNKESIDNVTLNKLKETEGFDITKCDYMTKQQLEKRGFKTGDIVFLDCAHKGIVYDKYISYITKISWDRIEVIKNKIIELIPVELIEECAEYTTAFNVSKLINKNEINETLHSFIIPIQEEPKIKTICKVNFVVGTDNPKEFILEDGQVKVGEIVEVCTGSTWQYARVKEIIEESLTDKQIKEYKVCRKLTE